MIYKVKDLPKVLQDAYYSIDTEDAVITIGQRNGLHLDQVADLHDLVSLVFLSSIKPQNFSKEVAKQVGTPQDKADIITAEINTQIFQPVHDELMKIQDTEAVSPPLGGETAKSELEEFHSALNSQGSTLEPAKVEPSSPQGLTLRETVAQQGQNKAPDIHEEKLTAPTQTAQKETAIDHRTQNSLIPQDHKERINKDPYKENI